MKILFSPVTDNYLQKIYNTIENQKPVKAVRLVKIFKSSPSTVHATLFRMQRDGLVVIDSKKKITLTERGVDRALSLARRRRLAETLLCEKLDIPLQEVGLHVYRFIKGFTPKIEMKLAEYLGNPKICPHGKPIPPKNVDRGIMELH